MKTSERYRPSDEAKAASSYFNTLPFAMRERLGPLLDDYRQRGLAEAANKMAQALRQTDERIRSIQTQYEDSGLALKGER